MAGKIIADIIEAPAGRISLNVANVTVASINASGLYTSTGNLIISQANQIGTAAIVDGAVTNAKLTLAANASNIKTALNASGDAPIFAARAWVNFNGTGTVAIRASGNVSSITDQGTGNYRINFTTVMQDASYSAVITSDISPAGAAMFVQTNDRTFSRTTSAFEIFLFNSSSAAADTPVISASVFR
jgi:hypothetical protein